MECELVHDGADFVCKLCGWRSKICARRNCPTKAGKPSNPPSLLERAVSFAAASARHALAGFPMRTEDQIKSILETHCQPCPEFTGRECRLCGCKTNEKKRLLNKLAMATEHCPLGKW